MSVEAPPAPHTTGPRQGEIDYGRGPWDIAPAKPSETIAPTTPVVERVMTGEDQKDDIETRYIDREILGKSVQTRLAISKSASEALSGADHAIARGRNFFTDRRTALRKARLDRAQAGYDRRERRMQQKHDARMGKYEAKSEAIHAKLDAQHEADQAWVNSASSQRIREKRQAKIDGKHAKRLGKAERRLASKKARIDRKYGDASAKLADYKANKLDVRREKHQESVNASNGRIEAADKRSAERQESIIEKRREVIAKRELAVARRELRQALRGSENSATMRETRAVLNDIFGDTEQGVGKEHLRDLGRKVVARQYAEKMLTGTQFRIDRADRQVASTTKLLEGARTVMESLPTQIEQTDKGIQELGDSLTEAYTKADKVKQVRTDGNGEINSLEHFSLMQQIDQARAAIAEQQNKLERLKQQSVGLPDKIAQLEKQLESHQGSVDLHRHAAVFDEARRDFARSQVDERVGTILRTEPAPQQPSDPSIPERRA